MEMYVNIYTNKYSSGGGALFKIIKSDLALKPLMVVISK